MYKLIRNKAPFVILGYSFLFAITSYFEFYAKWFKYLPDLLGYSLFTNLFMLCIYFNKRYCDATKITVVGLMVLNVFNLIYLTFNISGVVYDIYLMIIIGLLIAIIKLKK